MHLGMAGSQTSSLTDAAKYAATKGSAADREELVQKALAFIQQEGKADEFEAVIIDALPLLVVCAGASSAALDGFTRLVGLVAHHCIHGKLSRWSCRFYTRLHGTWAHAV